MKAFPLARTCRLSGEPLEEATVLFELEDCPLPGIYPTTAQEATLLRSPLRVVQARHSRLVQLAHVLDSRVYEQYAFAGGGSAVYREHLESVAAEVATAFPRSAAVLEVGCGDGLLLRRLQAARFDDVLGIDPSRAVEPDGCLVSGFFPGDLPPCARDRRFDLVICRHVIEHIEAPRDFAAALAAALAPGGQLWIEVPDLDSTICRGWWSNFYHLHCNYFTSVTLDALMAQAGLRLIAGRVVEVFGGSLLRKYQFGVAPLLPEPALLEGVDGRIAGFQENLNALAGTTSAGTVGYGAAERTAVTLGFAPGLMAHIGALYDGNPLLAGRFLAGTRLPIKPKRELFMKPPPAILLFAISSEREILAEWRQHLPAHTLVGRVGLDATLTPLAELA